ncbi:uncharacterized protein METZ01_LOCUS371084, partial [marine metagenome]
MTYSEKHKRCPEVMMTTTTIRQKSRLYWQSLETRKKTAFDAMVIMRPHFTIILSIYFLSLTCNAFGKGLSSDIPDLSTQALESLVAHYDG